MVFAISCYTLFQGFAFSYFYETLSRIIRIFLSNFFQIRNFCIYFVLLFFILEDFIHTCNETFIPSTFPLLKLSSYSSQNAPSQLHSLCACNLLSPVSVAHIFMGLGPCTVAWESYQSPNLQKECVSTSTAHNSSVRGRAWRSYTSIYTRILPGLILSRFCAVNPSFCE